MWQLLVAVVPLGLAAAITPTLFALQVLVVSGPQWRRRAAAVALGAGAVFAAVFAIVLAGFSQLPDAGTGRHGRIEDVVSLTVGAVLVPVGLWMLRPHPQADAAMERKVQGYAEHAKPSVFFGIAAYMSVTDFSSLLVMVPALHLVTSSAVPVAGKGFVVLVLFGMVMLPVILPPTAVLIGGEPAVRRLRRVYDAVMGHQIQVMGAVALVVGVVLMWRGVRGL
jgi:threonine/homoserine/homoserine lactone efflux protein